MKRKRRGLAVAPLLSSRTGRTGLVDVGPRLDVVVLAGTIDRIVAICGLIPTLAGFASYFQFNAWNTQALDIPPHRPQDALVFRIEVARRLHDAGESLLDDRDMGDTHAPSLRRCT